MSDDPVRLVDDPSAPAELRGDLGRAADAPGPAFELEGGLARLTAAIGALPGGGGPSSPGGSSVGGAIKGSGAVAGAKGGALGSTLLWGLAAAGVAGAAFVFLSPRDPPRVVIPPAVTAPSPVTTAPPSPTSTTAAAANETSDAPTETPSAAPASAAPAPSVAARRDRAVASAAPAEPPAAPTAADEIHDLAALRAAEGDPARALELANSGARRFPGGVFAIEREAIAITALARLGRATEARTRAQAFLAAHPKSVYAEQVRRAGNL